MSRWIGIVGTLVIAQGCFDYDGGNGCSNANGLAGNAHFTYECVGPGDPQCTSASNDAPSLPTKIALSARFGLSGDSGAQLVPVSNHAVEASSQVFKPLRTGYIGFVANNGTEALDALRFEVVAPASIVITAIPADIMSRSGVGIPPFDLRVGEKTQLRAIAQDSERAILAGTLTVEWATDAPDIVSIEDAPDQTARLAAHGRGRATIKATSGMFSATVTVTVGDGAEDAGISDAGTDASDAEAGDAS